MSVLHVVTMLGRLLVRACLLLLLFAWLRWRTCRCLQSHAERREVEEEFELFSFHPFQRIREHFP